MPTSPGRMFSMQQALRSTSPYFVHTRTVSPSAMPFASASLAFRNTGFAHASRNHGQLLNTLWERLK